MGNQPSNNKNNDTSNSFGDIIDYIASNFIITMNFKNLQQLYDKDYCNKLIILTKDIIKNNFNEIEISNINKRINTSAAAGASENILYRFNDNEKSQTQPINKEEMCHEISKFYILIAHLFSAIMLTVNPVYTYTDETNNTQYFNLFEKDKIPKNADVTISNLNICSNRINKLTNHKIFDESNKNIEVAPDICNNMNTKKGVKSLSDEPGIPELKNLYYDDDYDYLTGEFNSMSKTTKEKYMRDLKLFYTEFSGNAELPENINDFYSIKLKDYAKDEKCLNGTYLNKYTGSDELFQIYANNIKNMIQKTNAKQEELLGIINNIFTYSIENDSKKKIIKIHPELNIEKLNTLIKTTREIIIELYINCEKDFIRGIEIYEAIINKIGFQTLVNQQQHLENEILKIKNI
jgi:hypothetical protein